MKNIFACSFFLIFILQAYAQKPKWIQYNYRQKNFPKTLFLTGFSSTSAEAYQQGETLKRLETEARNELVQSIQSTIKVQSSVSTSGNNTNNKQYQFKQEYTDNSVVTAESQVIGLKTESYYDKKSKMAYGFTYIKLADLTSFYKTRIANSFNEIAALINESKADLSFKKASSAFPKLEKALSITGQISKQLVLLQALGENMYSASAYQDLGDKQSQIYNTIQLGIDKMLGEINLNIDCKDCIIDLRKSDNYISVKAMDKTNSQPMDNIPVVLLNSADNKLVGSSTTDSAGRAACLVNALNINSSFVSLKAAVDHEILFGIDSSTVIYRAHIKNNRKFTSKSSTARIKGFIVYVSASEKNPALSNTVPILINSFKQILSDMGCTITTKEALAELVVEVTASSRIVSETPNVIIANSDISFSFSNHVAQNQTFSQEYLNVRGFGNTPQNASANAIHNIFNDLSRDVKKNMIK